MEFEVVTGIPLIPIERRAGKGGKKGKRGPHKPRAAAGNIEKAWKALSRLEFEKECRTSLHGHDLMMDIFCERFLSLADEVNLVFQEAHHLRGNQDCSQAEILSYESHKRNKNNATHYML